MIDVFQDGENRPLEDDPVEKPLIPPSETDPTAPSPVQDPPPDPYPVTDPPAQDPGTTMPEAPPNVVF
jgi:hypothetical protein